MGIGLEYILQLYKETIGDNLSNLVKSDDLLFQQCKELLIASRNETTGKWSSGRKYIRTLPVVQAFSEYYPEGVLKISVYIDALVNNLDDLFDESLSKKERTFPIIEIFRTLGNFSRTELSPEERSVIGSYFDNIIVVATSEHHYYNFIKSVKEDVDKIIKYSIQLYDGRSLDMDVFVDLPAVKLQWSEADKKNLRKNARAYRALNLIKKDIEDYEHDKAQENESIITLLSEDKEILKEVVNRLAQHYKFSSGNQTKDTNAVEIVMSNLNSMIGKENRDLKLSLEDLIQKL